MNEKFILDSNETELKKPTHEAVVSITEFGGLNVAVSVVDARSPLPGSENEYVGRTLIWPQSYLARMDSFETQRQVVIAESLKARVIAVEMPGVGISENAKTPFIQKLDLLRGGFNRSANIMLGAMNEVVNFKDNESIEFLLYSQGGALGAAMLDNLGNEVYGLKLKVPRVTIIEAVNDQPWNLLKLLSAIGKEDAFTDRYLDENKKYDWLVPPSDRAEVGKIERKKFDSKQQVDMLLGGAALRKPFAPVILDAIKRDRVDGTTGISEARIDILKCDSSGVSRLEENCMTLKQLELAMPLGQVALTLLTSPKSGGGHYHPAVHSMPNMDIISRELIR